MRIIIAPIGNPLKLNLVKYKLDEFQEKSYSSLKIQAERYDMTFVLALDSLYNIDESKDSIFNEAYLGTIGKIRKNEMSNYEQIQKSIKEFVVEFGRKIGITKEITPIVLPAQLNLESKSFGSPGDFLAISLLKIWDFIKESQVEEVSLDLSNGPNYTSALSMKLMELLTDLILLKNPGAKTVVNSIYNADPIASDEIDKLKTYEIRKVYKNISSRVNISYRSFIEGSKEVIGKNKKSEVDLKKLTSEFSNIVKNGIKCLYYNIPLAMIYLKNEYVEDEIILSEELLNLWERNIVIKNGKFERLLRLNPINVFYLLIVETAFCNVPTDKNLNSVGKIAENILSKVNESGKVIVNEEIKKIRENIEEFKKWNGSKVFLKDIMDYDSGINNSIKPSKRILIAHAGLQREFVLVSKNGTIEYSIPFNEIIDNL